MKGIACLYCRVRDGEGCALDVGELSKDVAKPMQLETE